MLPRLQEVEDLQGDDLLYYDAEMEHTNMILLSIPNEIYNYVDSYKTAKEMWDRVERLMRGTIQNQVDRETRFTNEFDQFVAEPGESLVSVYNRFTQLMNDLERNNMKFPIVSVNTKFLNSLQPKWLKYVTQVRLAKKLTVDSFDDLFDYLSQFEKLVNASMAKKLEKSHDPLALVAHIDVRTSTPCNTSTGQCYNCGGKGHYARNCPKPRVRDSKYFMEQMLLAKQDEAGVILTDEQNDFLFADASRMEEIEELSANICLMARIQPADQNSDDEPSYESAFIMDSVGKGYNVYDLCAIKTLKTNAQNSKRASMFYTSKEEIALNDFCRDQVKPLLNELLDYFDGFQNLFQRDIKEMKDAFEQNDVYLDEIERQNDLLKDQLLEASLKHDIELCVLLNHECVDKSLYDEVEQDKKKSLEIQEGLKAKIKILEKDVQRCEKQSVDFELKLQHEKEKHKWDSSKNKNSKPLDFSWISRIQKLEDENVSLDFKV
ncbi:integrase, catalytic region, zinc finger, CCHC-type containing protein [Tanacetum coccineum]